MGRRSERLSKQGALVHEAASEGDVIQVVSRAFDILRCFEGHEAFYLVIESIVLHILLEFSAG